MTPNFGPYRNPTLSADGRWLAYEAYKDLPLGDTDMHTDVVLRDRLTGLERIVSVSSSGDGGTLNCVNPSMSSDGRFIAFNSQSGDLVPGDANGAHDVFVHDAWLGTTILVSANPSGTSGNGGSFLARISADGTRVVFTSHASDLVAGDANGVSDVFVRELQSGLTERVSVSSSGAEADASCDDASLSADGRFVVFTSAASTLAPGANGSSQIFLRDRALGTTEIVSRSSAGVVANLDSRSARISRDGRFVTFTSFATNLDPLDTHSASDVFVRDRASSTTELISRSQETPPAGATHSYGPSDVSDDGRYVTFVSSAHDLGVATGLNVFLFDRTELDTLPLNRLANGNVIAGAVGTAVLLTPDAHFAAFSNGSSVWMRDLNDASPVDELVYCPQSQHSGGCAGQLEVGGSPSVAGPGSLFLTATYLRPQANGLFFWGLQSASTPFHGGTLCVAAPIRRTQLQDSGGSTSAGFGCSGRYAFHFSPNFIALNGLSAGTTVFGQFYQRDSQAGPGMYALSPAARFTLAP